MSFENQLWTTAELTASISQGGCRHLAAIHATYVVSAGSPHINGKADAIRETGSIETVDSWSINWLVAVEWEACWIWRSGITGCCSHCTA